MRARLVVLVVVLGLLAFGAAFAVARGTPDRGRAHAYAARRGSTEQSPGRRARGRRAR